MQFDENGDPLPFDEDEVVHVVSCDEKPGIQAIANDADDLPPTEEHKTIRHDYKYKRLGTVSLLAWIDLQTGEALPLVSDSHNRTDYINFLIILDVKYPQGDTIRLQLDNLKVHKAKKVIEYLATVEGRFEFVFTPKHDSWLILESPPGKRRREAARRRVCGQCHRILADYDYLLHDLVSDLSDIYNDRENHFVWIVLSNAARCYVSRGRESCIVFEWP